MRKANVYVNDIKAGELHEIARKTHYRFIYEKNYTGPSVSLEMPTSQQVYDYTRFPPFFEGLSSLAV